MASRIMHYCIGKKILENIKTVNPIEFHIGNLVPDVSKWGNGDYERAHFGYTNEKYKGINYQEFLNKYMESENLSDYKLGYFVHLLTDAIWLKQIQDTYIRSKTNKNKLYELGYKDMYKLNPILIDKFKLDMLNFTSIEEEIDEIDKSWISELSKSLNDDFSVQFIDNEMQVYPLESIFNFIKEAESHCTRTILQIKNKIEIINPALFYVEDNLFSRSKA